MSIESILRRKGQGRHNNRSGSQHQESGGLAPRQEYRRSRGDERGRSSSNSFPNVKSFMHFLAMARQPGRCP